MHSAVCSTVSEWVDLVGPHQAHATYRADKPSARQLGFGCRDCGQEFFIGIHDFKESGDLPEYERLMKERYPSAAPAAEHVEE